MLTSCPPLAAHPFLEEQVVSPERIFYDGHCGLCHRTVRFVLARDRTGEAFRFAPLDSDAFRKAVPDSERARLPDSIVVQTADGRLLLRSSAVLHILRRLGGVWRLVALAGGCIPVGLRDLLYDGVARIRRRLFAPPPGACPLLPPHLRARFEV
jgi:predicted DCC family thiol-disulfide oxidoreductase YuxK